MKTAVIGNALGLILVALGLIMLAPAAVALLAMEFSAIPPFIVAAAVSAMIVRRRFDRLGLIAVLKIRE